MTPIYTLVLSNWNYASLALAKPIIGMATIMKIKCTSVKLHICVRGDTVDNCTTEVWKNIDIPL